MAVIEDDVLALVVCLPIFRWSSIGRAADAILRVIILVGVIQDVVGNAWQCMWTGPFGPWT